MGCADVWAVWPVAAGHVGSFIIQNSNNNLNNQTNNYKLNNGLNSNKKRYKSC